MEFKVNRARITVVHGDITDQDTDAIVNAANNKLVLGSGVAGAIRTRGGPAIQEECNRHGPISVGEAAITGSGNLRCRHVIHAASMGFGHPTDDRTLENSTRHSLQLADENGVRSISFPALGTGVSGFPTDRCAEIMIRAAREHLLGNTNVREVRFVLWGEDSFRIFGEKAESILS